MLICAKRCNECLFSNNKIVSDERKAEIIEDCLTNDTFFVCHKTDNTCCRGFWDNHNRDTLILRLAVGEFIPMEFV